MKWRIVNDKKLAKAKLPWMADSSQLAFCGTLLRMWNQTCQMYGFSAK